MSHLGYSPSCHRSRPLLRRQRPAVGVLLSQRLRLRRDRLRRPGNQDASTRPATSCARATSPSSSPRRWVRSIPTASASSSTATACRTSPWKWTTWPPPIDTGHRARRRRRHAADAARRRVRRLRIRHHPRLRRHDAQLRQPRPLSRRLRARLQAARRRPLQPAHLPSGRPAGHRPHRRQRRGRQDGRVGAISTSTCSASRSSSASTTRTSARNTRR